MARESVETIKQDDRSSVACFAILRGITNATAIIYLLGEVDVVILALVVIMIRRTYATGGEDEKQGELC
jgi:hypothetical protein